MAEGAAVGTKTGSALRWHRFGLEVRMSSGIERENPFVCSAKDVRPAGGASSIADE